MKFRNFLATILLLGLVSARGEVKLNGLFTDGAVLQQGIAVPVWGTARAGEKVTVVFQDQEVSTVAQEGRWSVRLKSPKAGGPFTLTVRGDNSITLTNVLVGEVWLCSGQSNMGFKLSRADTADAAIAAAGDAQLRLFTVSRESDDTPRTDVTGHWQESTPVTASNFSAVAYFFGRDLRRALKVPVALIDSSVGGTPAEAWTSRGALEADPELQPILAQYQAKVRHFDSDVAKRKQAAADAKAKGENTPPAAKAAANPARSPQRPTGLYNAMIAPLQPYALKGVIWYQGEANSGRAEQYQKLFPAMIKDWRTAWGQGDFPFLFVQIAPHERMTPEIREAQFLTAQRVTATAVIVTTDVGEAKDIHPKKKEPVGGRLALAARALAYGEKLEYSGPMFDALKLEGARAILSFTHVGGGLEARGGELKGFSVAGADRKFVSATAKIEGDKVVLAAAAVSQPEVVRYGWEFVPDVNLFNRAGLPASPFRTDRQ